jgi:hypothetical protein
VESIVTVTSDAGAIRLMPGKFDATDEQLASARLDRTAPIARAGSMAVLLRWQSSWSIRIPLTVSNQDSQSRLAHAMPASATITALPSAAAVEKLRRFGPFESKLARLLWLQLAASAADYVT